MGPKQFRAIPSVPSNQGKFRATPKNSEQPAPIPSKSKRWLRRAKFEHSERPAKIPSDPAKIPSRQPTNFEHSERPSPAGPQAPSRTPGTPKGRPKAPPETQPHQPHQNSAAKKVSGIFGDFASLRGFSDKLTLCGAFVKLLRCAVCVLQQQAYKSETPETEYRLLKQTEQTARPLSETLSGVWSSKLAELHADPFASRCKTNSQHNK